MTKLPFCNRCALNARPKPEAAPVTRATRSLSMTIQSKSNQILRQIGYVCGSWRGGVGWRLALALQRVSDQRSHFFVVNFDIMARGGRGSATASRPGTFGRSAPAAAPPARPSSQAPAAPAKPAAAAPPQQAPMQSSGGSGFLGTLAASVQSRVSFPLLFVFSLSLQAAGSMVGNVVGSFLSYFPVSTNLIALST